MNLRLGLGLSSDSSWYQLNAQTSQSGLTLFFSGLVSTISLSTYKLIKSTKFFSISHFCAHIFVIKNVILDTTTEVTLSVTTYHLKHNMQRNAVYALPPAKSGSLLSSIIYQILVNMSKKVCIILNRMKSAYIHSKLFHFTATAALICKTENLPSSSTRVFGELPCAMSRRAYESLSSRSNVSELNANHRAVCPQQSFNSRFRPPDCSSRANASELLFVIAACSGVLHIHNTNKDNVGQ